MPTKQIVDGHKKTMEKTLEHLHHEFRGVRTGRASTGLVENVKIEYYGNPTPLNQIASIAAPEASLIVIKPFDPASLKDIEKALTTSDLNLPPMVDGKVIRLNVPPLSTERRQQLANQVKQSGEKAKVSIRNIRRDANKQLEEEQKDKAITEDDRDKGKKDIDSLTKEHIDKIDDLIKKKSNEIMSD